MDIYIRDNLLGQLENPYSPITIGVRVAKHLNLDAGYQLGLRLNSQKQFEQSDWH